MTFADELIKAATPIWDEYYAHSFIQGIIDGSLDKRKFLRYLVQDTLYLKDYAKVYAHAFIKSDNINHLRHIYSDMALIMSDETMTHIYYMKKMGWTENEALSFPCATECRAYLDYMLEIARKGSAAQGVVSVMACAFSYYFIAKYAKEQALLEGTLNGNYYSDWINSYSGEMYEKIYNSSYMLCNEVCGICSETEKKELTNIFLGCCEYELQFWNMAFEDTDIIIRI